MTLSSPSPEQISQWESSLQSRYPVRLHKPPEPVVHDETVEINCQVCSGIFKIPPYKLGTAKYCSRVCADMAKRKRK